MESGHEDDGPAAGVCAPKKEFFEKKWMMPDVEKVN